MFAPSDPRDFEREDVSFGSELRNVVAFDIDGNGVEDLAVVDLEADGVWILRDDPSEESAAGFREPRRLDVTGAADVRATSLDGDAFGDLVILDTAATTFSVALGRDGDVPETAEAFTAATPVESWTVGDIDADGRVDLVYLAEGFEELRWMEGRGDGTFEDPESFEVETLEGLGSATRVCLRPLLGTLQDDIILAGVEEIVIVPNLGASDMEGGGFGEPIFLETDTSLDPDLLAWVDLDADGDLDISVGRSSGRRLSVFVQRDRGRFQQLVTERTVANPRAVAGGPLDSSGGNDLLVVSGEDATARILWSESRPPNTELGFSDSTVQLEGNFEPHSTAAADFDDDGHLDLATIDGEDRIQVLLNDGDGEFPEREEKFLEGANELIYITAADLDGDGDVDLAAVDEDTDVLILMLNRGDGSFEQGESHELGRRPFFVTTAELNGDGRLDIVCVMEGADTVEIFLNEREAEFDFHLELDVGGNPRSATSGDFDDDGDVDLAVVSQEGDLLEVLWNDGDAVFPERDDWEFGSLVSVIAVDIDIDGDLDLVAASSSRQRLVVFENDGDGGFSEEQTVDVERTPNTLLSVHLDDNAYPDVVSSNPGSDSVSVFLNGDGEFGEPLHQDVGREPRFSVAGDFDGDNVQDLVVANHDSFAFTVLLNDTPQPYREQLCTERDFYRVAAPVDDEITWRTRFTMPVVDGAEIPPLFQDLRRFATHQTFLDVVFPGVVAEADYEEIFAQRATRTYYTGILRRIRTDFGTLYGFDVEIGGADAGELLTLEETGRVYGLLADRFAVADLYYAPQTEAEIATARDWEAVSFPIYIADAAPPPPPPPPEIPFERGDVNDDAEINLTDAIVVLNYLFLGGAEPGCLSAADANDDGELNLTDGVALLSFLFLNTEPLPAPAGSCDTDPTPDDVSCVAFPSCDGGA